MSTQRIDESVKPNLSHRLQFLAGIGAELQHAYNKHGSHPWSRHEFEGILREEVDEAIKEIHENGTIEHLLTELMQVCAVCLRFAETDDRYSGPRLSIFPIRDGDTINFEKRHIDSLVNLLNPSMDRYGRFLMAGVKEALFNHMKLYGDDIDAAGYSDPGRHANVANADLNAIQVLMSELTAQFPWLAAVKRERQAAAVVGQALTLISDYDSLLIGSRIANDLGRLRADSASPPMSEQQLREFFDKAFPKTPGNSQSQPRTKGRGNGGKRGKPRSRSTKS